MTRVLDCRLVIDPPAAGAWNMAIDDVLLASAADEGIATLRFYEWSEPTLSLGYFQRYEDRDAHSASRECAAVRRQTGGGAILHDRELTYSIALPGAHPLARNTEHLYLAVHRVFIMVLQSLLAGSNPRPTLQIHEQESPLRPNDEPFLCFQRRAAGDIVMAVEQGAVFNAGEAKDGTPVAAAKILGSAQRRRRGAVLQHGSLLLSTSPAAPELPGLNNLAGEAVSIAQLTATLPDRLAGLFGANLNKSRLPDELQLEVRELCGRKYDSPAWTARR